jgi:uncharacterized membrane protein
MVHTDEPTQLHSLSVRLAALAVVAAVILVWLLYTPEGLLGKADGIGYAVCHRIDARSFHIGDRPMPLCVRCTGMFLGALLGLAYQSLTSPRRAGFPGKSVWAVLALILVAFGLDGVNSYFHLFPGFTGLYEPNHALRLLTGIGMGAAMAVVLYPAFHQTVWREFDRRPAIGGLRDLAILLGLALLLAGLVWLQNPVLLYPLALLSAGGVLALLILVYTMVSVMILRMENRAHTAAQLALPLIMGVGLAFLQIGGLDLVRYLLTGTWDGFHFG